MSAETAALHPARQEQGSGRLIQDAASEFFFLFPARNNEEVVDQPRPLQLQDERAQLRRCNGDRRLGALRQVLDGFVQPDVERVPESHVRQPFPFASPA